MVRRVRGVLFEGFVRFEGFEGFVRFGGFVRLVLTDPFFLYRAYSARSATMGSAPVARRAGT